MSFFLNCLKRQKTRTGDRRVTHVERIQETEGTFSASVHYDVYRNQHDSDGGNILVRSIKPSERSGNEVTPEADQYPGNTAQGNKKKDKLKWEDDRRNGAIGKTEEENRNHHAHDGRNVPFNETVKYSSKRSSVPVDSVPRDELWYQYLTESSHLNVEMARLEKENMRLQQQLMECRDEKEDLQNRLSEYVAIKVTDNNPDIVNLGDKNRPEKLAERFSELYDNQWTEAFEYLIESERKSDEDAIHYLLTVLKVIFDVCEEKAHAKLRTLEKAIKTMIGIDEIPEHMSTHMKMYKEERKKNTANIIPVIRKTVFNALKSKGYYIHGATKFVEEATDICWIMCIQDPPMVLVTACQQGDKIDRSRFRHYTNAGKFVAYLVWPAVCLYDGGPVISKGVAEGHHKKSKKHSLLKRRDPANAENTDSHRSQTVSNTKQNDMDKTTHVQNRVCGKDGQPVEFSKRSSTVSGFATESRDNESSGIRNLQNRNYNSMSEIQTETGRHSNQKGVYHMGVKSFSHSDTYPASVNRVNSERRRSSMETGELQTHSHIGKSRTGFDENRLSRVDANMPHETTQEGFKRNTLYAAPGNKHIADGDEMMF